MSELTEQTQKDALRWQWLKEHNATLLECVTERRGFLSTDTNAVREVWMEHDGWIVSTMDSLTESYATMDEAVDAAMTNI